MLPFAVDINATAFSNLVVLMLFMQRLSVRALLISSQACMRPTIACWGR
jgi:hypothetical protein